jgi:hypothetical protein
MEIMISGGILSMTRVRQHIDALLGLLLPSSGRTPSWMHYGLKSPLLILIAFTCPVRAARCLDLVATLMPQLAPFVLVQTVPNGFSRLECMAIAITKTWSRSRMEVMGVW